MRKLIIAAAAIGVLAAVLLAVGWRWLHSEGGNRWLVERAIVATDGALVVDGLQGRLKESLTARALVWDADGVRVEVEDIGLQGGVSGWPPTVTLTSAAAGAVRITIDATAEDVDEPPDWTTVIDGLNLPLALEVEQWTVGTVELLDGAGGRERLLNGAEGGLRWSDALVLPAFAWEAPAHTGRGSLELGLQAPYRHALTMEADAPALTRSPALSLSLVGDETETVIEASADGLDRLDASGVVTRAFDSPVLRVDVEAPSVGLSGEPDSTGLQLRDLLLSLDGTPGDLAVDAEGVLAPEASAPMPWTLEGRLAPSTFTIEALAIEAGDRRYIAEGVASLLPGRVHLDPLALRSLDGEARLSGDLHFDLETEEVDVDLEWAGLSWPLEGGDDAWRSPRGSVVAAGTTAAWSGSASVDVLAPGLPESGAFEVEAEGDLERSRFRVTGTGSFLERLAGEGELAWQDALRFDWQGSVSGLDARPFLEDWPSAIDAQLRYSLADDTQRIDIDSLGGTVRGERLSGAGRVEERGGRWVFQDLQIGVGEARFDLEGAWPGGRLSLESAVPPGSPPARWLGFEAEGFLSLDESVAPPRLVARLAGWGPELDGLTLGAWTLEGDSRDKGLMFDAELPRAEEALAGQVSGALQTTSTGTQMSLTLDQGSQTLALALESGPVAWTRDMTVKDLDLTGRLTELEARQADEILFRLGRPTPFRVADGQFSLSEACGTTVGGGSACLGGAVDTGGELALDATLEALPLAPLAARLGLAIVPDQSVDGEFSFRRAPGELPSGLLVLDLSPGALRDPEDPDSTLETGPARVNLMLDEGQIRSGVFEVPLPGVGSIEGSLDAADVRLDGSGTVQGRARFRVADLSSLGVLLPDLERISGGMSMELDLTGSVGEPILDGLVRLEDVSFSVPYLGLEVTDLNGEGYARGQGEAALQATFRVGEGEGTLVADVDLTPGSGLPFIFRIEGENLRLVETPDIELDANPAFDLSWSDGAWTIDGSLAVPRLRLSPRSILVGQVSESEDVVIVAGDAPPSAPPPIYANDQFFGQLELVLGEDITLETEDAQARVGGGLTLNWNGPPEPLAEGALNVKGEIEVFGPVLRISDGNLRFPGVPVSNPVLDLRAERDVFGNTQIRAAGVAISGTARRPTIEAYTRPFTTRDRAWALLITGQDFDQGQSITALEVGAYIAPRVYVSYGVSLFDDENVASVRYDFSRGFGIKATSGVRQTGVDISYTIEND